MRENYSMLIARLQALNNQIPLNNNIFLRNDVSFLLFT